MFFDDIKESSLSVYHDVSPHIREVRFFSSMKIETNKNLIFTVEITINNKNVKITLDKKNNYIQSIPKEHFFEIELEGFLRVILKYDTAYIIFDGLIRSSTKIMPTKKITIGVLNLNQELSLTSPT